MAKRFKIKGKVPSKTPRGLSKAERIMDNAETENYRRSGDPGSFGGQFTSRELIEMMGLGGVATRPSSTRKKRVKEGSRKFIGPRTLESEISEDAATRFRESFGPSRTGKATPSYVMRNVGKKGNLPRISKPKKQKTASGSDSRIKALIALKRLSESGQLPGEVGRMLRDIPGI